MHTVAWFVPETIHSTSVTQNNKRLFGNSSPSIFLSELGISPVNLQQLKKDLKGYDSEAAAFLISGFESGFSLCCNAPPKYQPCKNLKSALENPDIVWEKINKEILAGRVAGPFSEPPFENFRASFYDEVI